MYQWTLKQDIEEIEEDLARKDWEKQNTQKEIHDKFF